MVIKSLSLSLSVFLSLPLYLSTHLSLSQASQHSTVMLTTEGAPHAAEHIAVKMDVEDADMTRWTEAEFEEKCTYIVKDHPLEGGCENPEMTRAEASLPRNLLFKHPPNSKEVGR